MRRIALLLCALSLLVPLHAQRVKDKPFDVTLRDLSIEEVIELFGKPVQIDSGLIDGGLMVEYPHAKFYYYGTWDVWEDDSPNWPPDRYVSDGFETDSPDFCIFSDLFPGGIRVGDRIERVRKLDIVHSKAGKGRDKNALHKVDWGKTGTDVYEILSEEYDHFYLEVKDSVICSIDWSTPIDWGWSNGGLLWRIEGKSLPAPSYILGTFPYVPADFCQRIEGLDKAWKSVKTIYREDPDLGPWGRTIPESMFLPDGKKLASLYEWEEYVDIQDYVKNVTGFRPEDLWWTPDGLTRHLRNCLQEQALSQLTEGQDDMSAYLYKRALSEGKTVHILPSQFRGIDNWEKRDKNRHDWNLLRLVWYPEGEPDYVKDCMRKQYEAFLSQDLDEIGYRLCRESSSPVFSGIGMEWAGGWSDELEKAIQEGPTLIMVDVSYLINYYIMQGLIGGRSEYRITSVKPVR